MLQWNAAFNELNDKGNNPTVAGKFWIAPMPAGPDGHKTHIHSLGIGLNKASTHKEAAGKFLASSPRRTPCEVYGKAGGTPPVPAVLDALKASRPEFPLVGDYAAKYGFVIRRRHQRPGRPGLRDPGPELHRLLGRPARPRSGARERRDKGMTGKAAR